MRASRQKGHKRGHLHHGLGVGVAGLGLGLDVVEGVEDEERVLELLGRGRAQGGVIEKGDQGRDVVAAHLRCAQCEERAEERAGVEADPFVMAVMQAFPGAVLGEIKTLAAPVELPVIPDEAGDED